MNTTLTNLDISNKYRNIRFCLLPSDFSGAFAYWVVYQNPNRTLIDIRGSLLSFNEYILQGFANPKIPEYFTYDSLMAIINEDDFSGIPLILKLNEMEPDFIDLGALARNILYMIMREVIVTREYEVIEDAE